MRVTHNVTKTTAQAAANGINGAINTKSSRTRWKTMSLFKVTLSTTSYLFIHTPSLPLSFLFGLSLSLTLSLFLPFFYLPSFYFFLPPFLHIFALCVARNPNPTTRFDFFTIFNIFYCCRLSDSFVFFWLFFFIILFLIRKYSKKCKIYDSVLFLYHPEIVPVLNNAL